MPVMMTREQVNELFDDLDWPPWAPVLSAVVFFFGVAIGLSLALLQRSHYFDLTGPVIAAGLVLLPFALDVVDAVMPFLAKKTGAETVVGAALPIWLFPVPVLLGELYLVSNPTPTDVAPFTLVILSAGMASRSLNGPTPGIVTALASMAVMVGVDVFGPWDGSFIWVIGITLGWVGGFMVWILTRKTLELKAAQANLSEKAAADERSRIAREVHDVIAHSLSVTMLHVTAARMTLEKGGRSAEALDALREAEEQGRSSLKDIRRTVGLLGSDGSGIAPALPTAADLPKLVQDFRSAGLDATLSTRGDVHALDAAAGLNLYRIVQESLTNVAKHAPGANAHVELNVTDDDIRLRVHNSPGNGATPHESSDGGIGLRGMAERAALLGGTLAADRDDDGWTVFVHAPRPAASTT